jgi:hypothetical protein
MSLDHIRYCWPDILIRAKAALPTVGAILDRAEPLDLVAGRLEVGLALDTADQVAALTPDRLSILAEAVEQETGLDIVAVSLAWAESGEPVPPPSEEAAPPEEPPVEKRKAATGRDPLAELHGENIRYNLLIRKPPGMGRAKLAPWWERRQRREALVRKRRQDRARKAAEETEADVERPENETLAQTNPGSIDFSSESKA